MMSGAQTVSENNTDREWPHLIEESDDLLSASILMYGITDLRDLARKGQLKEGDANRILSLPFTIGDVWEVATNNKQVLEASFGPQSTKLYGSAISLFLGKAHRDESRDDVEVVAFDDENSETELVYAIAVGSESKRVTVAFRGTVTIRDFLVDADGKFCDLDNPLNADSKEKLGIHHGFFEYLNGTTPTLHSNGAEGQMNKYTEIVSKLKPIFERHQDYRLYVTGHSLGASLAMLFAVEVAGSTEYSIPKPVTCINFASPKVGNVYFRNCFQSLESKNMIRSVRFVNAGDLIPTLPDRQNWNLCRTLACKPSVYRHAGPKIILYSNGDYKAVHEKTDAETYWKFACEVRYTFGHGIGFVLMIPTLLRYKSYFLTNHGCGEYLRRFHTKFADSDICSNDLYKKES